MHLPIAASELQFIAVSKTQPVFKYGRDWHELRAVAIGDDEQEVVRLLLPDDPRVTIGQPIVLERVAASTGILLVGTVRSQDGAVLVEAGERDLGAYSNGNGDGHGDLGEHGLGEIQLSPVGDDRKEVEF